MTASSRAVRYTSVAIVLHWTIAILIIGQLAAGLWMTGGEGPAAPGSLRFDVYQLHKSFGITVLTLSFARLAWRFLNPPPPLPASMNGLERLAAHATHVGFYVLMLALPLTGWALVSSSPSGFPTILFGAVDWPHLPVPAGRDIHELFEEVHEYLAFGAIALIALHVGAALKHQILDRENTLGRMAPGVFGATDKPQHTGRGLIAAIAAPVVFLAAVFVSAADQPHRGAPALSPSAEVAEQGHDADTTDITVTEAEPVEADARAIEEEAAPDISTADTPATQADADPVATPDTTEAASTSAPVEAPAPAAIPSVLWDVDTSASRISFSGQQSGQPFDGAFNAWNAHIEFDPDNLTAARAVVTIDVSSAATGGSFIDGAIPSASWLDASAHPEARFAVSSFRAVGDGSYEASGELTLKGVTQPITLPFTLALDGDAARAEGRVTLDRRAFAIGTDDPDNDGAVSGDITVDVVVQARRAN